MAFGPSHPPNLLPFGVTVIALSLVKYLVSDKTFAALHGKNFAWILTKKVSFHSKLNNHSQKGSWDGGLRALEITCT